MKENQNVNALKRLTVLEKIAEDSASSATAKKFNKLWQPYVNNRLLCGGCFFYRKRDALSLARQHRASPFTDYDAIRKAVKIYHGVCV